MSSSYHEIPTLPLVVPPATAAFVAMVWRLRRRAALTLPRAVVVAILCVYAAGVVAHTVLPVFVGPNDNHLPWRVFLNLTPLVNTDPSDMVKNVVVFVPLGFLLPLVARADSFRRVLLGGFLVSLSMEVVQFVNAVTGHGGHVADINDLWANTLGACVGYGVFRAALLVPAGGRLADAATVRSA